MGARYALLQTPVVGPNAFEVRIPISNSTSLSPAFTMGEASSKTLLTRPLHCRATRGGPETTSHFGQSGRVRAYELLSSCSYTISEHGKGPITGTKSEQRP